MLYLRWSELQFCIWATSYLYKKKKWSQLRIFPKTLGDLIVNMLSKEDMHVYRMIM